MKRPLVFVLIALMLASLACSVNIGNVGVNTTAGPKQTFTVQEPLPSGSEPVKIDLGMGAGTLNLGVGASGLMDGTVEYNLEGLKPTLTHNGQDYSLKQEHIDRISFTTDVINDWNLKLNDSIPMNLDISAGAYQGTMDFSGLRLQKLSISDGASQTNVSFKTPNPEKMSELSYKTGASQVKMTGLANANFDEMSFESGAGDYTLDFTGTLQRDATVSVKSGVSQVTIIVPKGMPVKVNSSGALNNVDTQGTWTSTDHTYETTGQGSTLTIEVNMGVGSLKLVQQ